MNREPDSEDIGEQLGVEGVANVVNKVEAYCAYEETRIALTNQPKIVALRAEASLLLEEKRDLTSRLKLAPPPGDLRSRRRRIVYYICVATFLTVAAFVFSLYSLEPFRFGLKGYLYSLGIAVVTPFLVDQIIERLDAQILIKSLATVACAASLAGLMLLAVIRGDLLAESMKDSNPVIVIDDAPTQAQPSQSNFYEKTTPLLQLLMILLAFAMELGAGLALHEAWRLIGSCSTEDRDQLRNCLTEIHKRMVALTVEMTTLQNEPRVVSARFWRNFYRAMLTHTIRSAITKFLITMAVIFVGVRGDAAAQNHTTIVIAVDLTRSVAVRNPDGKSEFQKNIDAVTKQLSQVSADSQVTVIGITDHSFTQPDILISATIPADAGYFGERLKAALTQLVRVWKRRSAKLEARYGSTDTFGGLLLAEQIFSQHRPTGDQVLVVFSDMRHSTNDLNLERYTVVPKFSVVNSRGRLPVANLREVQVFILGADGAGQSTAFWRDLQEFWTEYFKASHAVLRSYTPLRDVVTH